MCDDGLGPLLSSCSCHCCFKAVSAIVRILTSPFDLHTCICTCTRAKTAHTNTYTQVKEEIETHTLSNTHTPVYTDTHTHTHERQAASKLGFCVAPHANEAKRSEMNPLSQRGAWGVLQAESSVREGAWQANAPSVDSFHWTSNGKRWGPTTAFFHAIGFPFYHI